MKEAEGHTVIGECDEHQHIMYDPTVVNGIIYDNDNFELIMTESGVPPAGKTALAHIKYTRA